MSQTTQNSAISQNPDIRFLGKMLGDVIRAYGGEKLFKQTEYIRSSSVDRFRGVEGADQSDRGLGALSLDDTLDFVRGFMLFVDVLGAGDEAHRGEAERARVRRVIHRARLASAREAEQEADRARARRIRLRNQVIRDSERAEAEAADAVERAAIAAVEVHARAAEQIRNVMAEALRDVFSDGLDGFEDFADAIGNVFTDLAAEIAASLAAEAVGLDDLIADLETALSDILACFRPGRSTWLGSFLTRRIDRILVCATKADHLHRESHRRLEAIVRRIVDDAVARAKFSGARTDVLAMAAVRATREATVSDSGEDLPVIVGTPASGETIGERTFDGRSETAVFPGDLPEDPRRLFDPAGGVEPGSLRFVRFRPPVLQQSAERLTLSLPHIRLDRALAFLLGDRLQ